MTDNCPRKNSRWLPGENNRCQETVGFSWTDLNLSSFFFLILMFLLRHSLAIRHSVFHPDSRPIVKGLVENYFLYKGNNATTRAEENCFVSMCVSPWTPCILDLLINRQTENGPAQKQSQWGKKVKRKCSNGNDIRNITVSTNLTALLCSVTSDRRIVFNNEVNEYISSCLQSVLIDKLTQHQLSSDHWSRTNRSSD